MCGRRWERYQISSRLLCLVPTELAQMCGAAEYTVSRGTVLYQAHGEEGGLLLCCGIARFGNAQFARGRGAYQILCCVPRRELECARRLHTRPGLKNSSTCTAHGYVKLCEHKFD